MNSYSPRCSHAAAISAAAAVFVFAIGASANPEPLPFSYVPETLEKGQLEVEQYADYTPTLAQDGATGNPAHYAGLQFQTELEYGITPKLELGLYVTLAPQASGDVFRLTPQMQEGTGVKQRLKYHFTDPATFPIDLSGYFEITEKEAELELEAKIIAGRRFGPLRAILNLVGEREFYFDGHAETVLNPSAGVVYQATYVFQPGVEAWMHAEYQDSPAPGARPFALGPHVYVGPTALLQFQKIWWSTGFYFRVSDLDTPLAVGDAYGKVWLRLLVGVPL